MTKNLHAASNALIAASGIAESKPTKVKPEVISTPAAASKADKAREVFNDAYSLSPVPARKVILDCVIGIADLTPAGAATYLQNYKRSQGLMAKQAA